MLAGAVLAGCVGYGLYPPPAVGQPETVAVTLREDSIELWPRLIRKGRVVLEVTNAGVLQHALEMVGPGGKQQVGGDIGAGEQQRVTLSLGPGKYRLYCPDSDHARRGMTADLDVEETTSWFRR